MTARSEHVVDNLDAVVSMADTNVQNSIEGRKLSYFLCGMGSPIDDRGRGDHDWQEYYFYRLQDGFSHLGTRRVKIKLVYVVDVLGHSRLRPKLDEFLSRAVGIVFVVDALEFLPNCRAASEYLHEPCNSKIIHRDSKANNMLLEGGLKGAVRGDFGLATLVDVRETNMTTLVRE
ncbi:hypothetical protein PVL29_002546 [Vitis rotundifolia]|uniref:Protein kinase domain-containing protein n=1 Tax=Vitis rotundifolia TaxID=103349 RepID=A0AA39E2X0_VITRO|nr:hypothetical protein PVL29_002546 [Vitis rotundifolia]